MPFLDTSWYFDCMNKLPESINVKKQGITAVIGVPQGQAILELMTQLALLGEIDVIVGGNRFDAHTLARLVRRRTVLLDETLERIKQRRPFTCIQMVKLLEGTKPASAIVVLDMLTTFYDETVEESESWRLARLATKHLHRLGQQSSVLVTLRPPTLPSRTGLIEVVQDAADHIYLIDEPETVLQGQLL